MKHTIKIIDGKDLFILHSEKGLTLDISLTLVIENKMIVQWDSFISEATKNNWKREKIYNTIKYACKECGYNLDYFKRIIK